MYIFICILFFSTNLYASDSGINGIIDIPSARMDDDGTLKVTFSHQDLANISNITYQATPWLQTTFRYTYGSAYKDRSYAAKITLLKENHFLPSIAIGANDILGTGVFASEYIVASKKTNNLDFTIGLGWGRLADRNNIKNPLISLSEFFADRNKNNSEGGGYGGKLRNKSFFSGPNVGIFGGIKYKIPNTNFKLLAEYNTDSYRYETSSGFMTDSSPLSYGIEWNGLPDFSFKLTHQHENQLGFSFSTNINTSANHLKRKIEPFYSSSDNPNYFTSPETLNFNNWYHRLLYDVEQSGLYLRSAKILPDNRAIIEFSNFRYNLTADAINRVLTLSQIHLPGDINKIDLVLNENGFNVMTVRYMRGNTNSNFVRNDNFSKIEILRPSKLNKPTNITKRIVPHTHINANLAARFQLFDPDNPAKHQIFLKIDSVTSISQHWNLIGSFALDIDNNFDLKRGPGSVLEHVRTDINKYLVYGSSGLESLYLEKKSTYNEKIHYRAYAGVLESMYSGLGVEILYQPFMSRIAVGGTINRVIKRNYSRNLKLLDYKTSTGFLSLYYASPLYNYDFALHIGKYLAKDKGATFEVRRTFDNGFSVGAFATFTNVSASDFGEGSFDKGLFFRIPFDSLMQNDNKGSYTTVIRSLQRDGGQKLDDFTGRLWFDLRGVRYDSLINNRKRMTPK